MGALVTVVIPTHFRPSLVSRAIESVLKQTYSNFEIVVVSDGPDADTAAIVNSFSSSKVAYLETPRQGGACAARNLGIREAKGQWIALLDDDDEWMPEKLDQQMHVASGIENPFPIIACRAYVNRGISTAVWPARPPREDEDLSEYIFCRPGIGQGSGLITTSMLLAPKELFVRVPFDPAVKRHQDTDWILRATAAGNARLLWVWKPLLLFNLEVNRASVSRSMTAIPSLEWAEENPLLTKKAYSYFLATQVAPRIKLRGNLKLTLSVTYDFLTRSRVSFRTAFLFFAFLLTTPEVRHRFLKRI
jgi:glycosyltransferase involved in cell wall biosynthesis